MNIGQYTELFEEFFNDFYNALDLYLFQIIDIDNEDKERITRKLLDIIQDDILALIEGDPSARNNENSLKSSKRQNENHKEESIKYVLNSYKSLNAVIMYRVANFIYRYGDEFLKEAGYEQENINNLNNFLRTQARKLSEKTKVSTGVEIHPAARIGLRFVIDHGFGTVIGETCEIGNGCYILQGVTLGASGIKNNETGRRHPKLGDNVEVAGCARIFGPVEIGCDTKICGYAVIDRDIPPKSRVSIVNQIQLVSPNNHSIVIYGLRPKDNGLEIIGRNLNRCQSVNLLNSDGTLLDSVKIKIQKSDDSLILHFENIEIEDPQIYNYIISLNINKEYILIENSIGWRDFINKIIRKI